MTFGKVPAKFTHSRQIGLTCILVSLILSVSGERGLTLGQSGLSKQEELASRIHPTDYTSARVCGECHTDIYASWKNSLHAFSLIDPIFDTAYMQAIKAEGDQARKKCLHCHAPMTMFNGDYELSQGVSREGVSCDFCHTVTAVHLDGREKAYSTEPGPIKRSVLKKAASPAHEVAYSELHSRSEFCGGCHTYIASSGAALMSTYQEWLEGPYPREGIQCQDCHMNLSEGRVVAAGLPSSNNKVHRHSLIHDTNQLRSALKLDIVRAHRKPGELEVEVRVENVGSGHMVPTGLPTREIVLEVTADVGRQVFRREQRYRKVVADERGQLLKADYEVLLYGAKILRDNRIAPREVRMERFLFPLRASETATVRAELSYSYAPAIVGVKKMDIQLSESERFVK